MVFFLVGLEDKLLISNRPFRTGCLVRDLRLDGLFEPELCLVISEISNRPRRTGPTGGLGFERDLRLDGLFEPEFRLVISEISKRPFFIFI
jgi:hypothetical protein